MQVWIREMLQKWQRAVEARREDKACVVQAVSHFEVTYGKPAVRGMSRVIHRDDNQVVVRICHGRTRPPRRTYFAISSNDEIAEVAFEAVKQYGERPWR